MLQLNDLFISIDGEVSPHTQGALSTFIRFAGCNLECKWCDAYNHEQVFLELNTKQPAYNIIYDLMNMLGTSLTTNVTITGGEPLLAYYKDPEAFTKLLEILYIYEHDVVIETNGTYYLPDRLNDFIHGWVVDCKMPMVKNTGVSILNQFAGIYDTVKSPNNIVKFLVNHEDQFDMVVKTKNLIKKGVKDYRNMPTFAVSIINDNGELTVEPYKFVQFFGNRFHDDIILNTQIHKYLELK